MTYGHIMNDGRDIGNIRNIRNIRALRRDRERLQRRKAILDAARKVFVSKGFRDATVADIAARCGLAKGTIYLYFQSKEEIYVSLTAMGLSLLRKDFEKVASQPLKSDRLLEEMLDSYVRFYARHKDYFSMMFLSSQPDVRGKVSEAALQASVQEGTRCLQIVCDVIKKGIDEGVFRPGDPWAAANILWAMSNGIIRSYEQDPIYKDEIAGATLADMLGRGLDMAMNGLMERG